MRKRTGWRSVFEDTCFGNPPPFSTTVARFSSFHLRFRRQLHTYQLPASGAICKDSSTLSHSISTTVAHFRNRICTSPYTFERSTCAISTKGSFHRTLEHSTRTISARKYLEPNQKTCDHSTQRVHPAQPEFAAPRARDLRRGFMLRSRNSRSPRV